MGRQGEQGVCACAEGGLWLAVGSGGGQIGEGVSGAWEEWGWAGGVDSDWMT